MNPEIKRNIHISVDNLAWFTSSLICGKEIRQPMLTKLRFILMDRNVLQGFCEVFSAEEFARTQEDNLELVLKLSKLVLKSIKNDSVKGGRNPNEISVEPKTVKMDEYDTNTVNPVLEVESGGETPSFDNSYID